MTLPSFENLKVAAIDAEHAEQWQKAHDIWALLHHHFPEQVSAWLGLAKAKSMLQQWSEAEILLEKASTLFPDELDIPLKLAEIYYLQGKYDAAQCILKKTDAQWIMRAEPGIMQLRSFIHAKTYAQAEALAEQMIIRFPDHPELLALYAETAVLRGDWDAALMRWTAYRICCPEDALGFEQGARCLRELGRAQDARKLLLTYEYGKQWLEEVEGNKHSHLLAIPEKRSFSNHFNLIITKALLNLKSEASRNKLSYLWWIIEPILYILIFYIVFTFILSRSGENYIIILLTGMIPFTWFAKGVQVSSSSILYGVNILENIKISAIFFPAVSVVQTTIKEIPVFIIFIVFLIYYGFSPTVKWIELVPIVLLEALFIFSLGLLCAVFVPFLKDLQQIIPTFIQFLMFVSGVFYGLDAIPNEYHKDFLLNPMANIIYQYRLVIIDQDSIDWGWVKVLCLQMLLLLTFSLSFFYILRERFFKAIMN